MARPRSKRISEIKKAIGERTLTWFGTRGIDAQALAILDRLSLVVGQIAPLDDDAMEGVSQDNLELRTRLRRDLDQYDIDTDLDLEAQSLRGEFLARIDAPVVLVAYRPHEFLCRPSFCLPNLLTAANFHLGQRQFEHKPWVERQLRELGDVPVLASVFVRDSDTEAVEQLLGTGPMVGRCSTSSGGAGVFTFSNEEEYLERIPSHRDGFVGIAPLLDGATPLNVNACVYKNGGVSVFGVSYQLIGIRGLTRRSFGFCGNDFAAASDLDPGILNEIQRICETVGAWLHRLGYLGVFGLDLLHQAGKTFVIELNARFQASTALSASINQTHGDADPMTEHVAAFLGLDPPAKHPTVAEQAANTAALSGEAPLAQALHRNISTTRLRVIAHQPVDKGILIEGAPLPGIHIEREAMLFKSLHRHRITTDGYSVSGEVQTAKPAVKVAVT